MLSDQEWSASQKALESVESSPIVLYGILEYYESGSSRFGVIRVLEVIGRKERERIAPKSNARIRSSSRIAVLLSLANPAGKYYHYL